MLIQAGQQSEALVTFTNAREINRVAETNDKRPEVLKQMALAFAQTGYLIEAEQTIQVIDNSENQALVLRDIAVILMQTGYQDKAMEFIEHAKEAAYICRSDTALRALVPVLVQLKDFVEAEQVAKAINFSASRMAALGEIVTALAKSGQLAEAERLVKSMETGGHQAIALRELASAKQHTEVEQKVQLIDSSKNLVPAIIAILSDFLDMENLKVLLYKKSRKTRWRCVVRLRSDCYSQIADALAPGDCQVQASKMLDEAEQLARLLGSSKGRVETLRKLKGTLIHLAQSGYVLEAERVACSIENEEQRSKALSHLATAMALTMNFKGAFNTVGLLDMNTFLSVLSEWTSAFEKLEPGLLAKILKEVVRIFGWVHPDWQKLSQLFDAKALHKNKA